MHLLFIDESGTLPPKGKEKPEDKFVLGGVSLSEETWFKVDTDLKMVKRKYSVSEEIKWRHFYKTEGKESPLSHLEGDKKENLRKDIFRIITRYKSIKIITVVADVSLCYQRHYIPNADDLYWFCYKRLTERFQYYLQDLSKEAGGKMNGIVVCDHRERRQDKRLQDMHYRMLHGQERYTSKFENILEGVFIVPSHYSTGIQLADMVAGGLYRWFAKDDERFFKQISTRIRTSTDGKMEGYGVVRL